MNDNEQQRIKATKRAVDEAKESEKCDLEIQTLKDKIEALKQKYGSAQTQLSTHLVLQFSPVQRITEDLKSI